MEHFLQYVGKAFITVALAISSLFGGGVAQAPAIENVGATIPVPVAVFQTSLQASISTTDTSMTLVTGTDKSGDALSGYICFTLDEGTSIEEFVCGTTAGTAVTSMIRGIDPVDGDLEVTALKKAHRRGASVKVTNYPSLGILSRILNGTETLPNAISYASGVGPTASSDLADKEYVLSVVSGGAVTFEKVVITGTAGETVAAGNLVYLKSSDSRWWKTDADTASTVENVILGIAQGSGTAGNTIGGGVLVKGIDSNQSGLSASTVYYASNTAGGLSSTVGTKEVTIGIATSTTAIVFAPRYNQEITEDLQDALAGSTGTPSSTNKFLTESYATQNISQALTDQTQTTQNSTIEVGEASTTGKKNSLSQSFIPTKTKMRGINLYKSANTGTFTGTVKVALQVDFAGSPSGGDVASKTFTNVEWNGLAVGEIEAIFSSEYTNSGADTTFWIVISTSTADNSNHPNFGTNTAGGYGSGSVKYNNATDGWVVVSTIDLYFKTIEGNASQIVKTNTSGKIESAFYDVAEMPIPAYQQMIPMLGVTDGTYSNGGSATQDGSVLILSTDVTLELFRFARDSYSGQYVMTHNVSATSGAGATSALQILGNYVYLFVDGGNFETCYRYDLATLANETSMTMPSIDTAGSNYGSMAWTDGTFMYLKTSKTNTTAYKMSVSGTTFTTVTTSSTFGTLSGGSSVTTMFDGTNNYAFNWGSSDTATIYKGADVYISSATSTAKLITQWTDIADGAILINIDANRAYIGRLEANYDETTQVKAFMNLIPITKP